MKAKLELNGKEYEVEIGDEVVEQIESKTWEPEKGEVCHILCQGGSIISSYYNAGTREDVLKKINDTGFLFQYKGQAEKYRTWLKWIAEVRRWNVENGNVNVNIKSPTSAYVYWKHDKNEMARSYGDYPECGSFYFKNIVLAEKFIQDFSEEKIIEMMKLQQEVMEMA